MSTPLAILRVAVARALAPLLGLVPLDARRKFRRMLTRSAELTAGESDAIFRAAGRLVSMAVFRQDPDLRYTWMFSPQLGYTPEQIVGYTDFELLPAADAARVVEIKRRALATGALQRETVSVMVDGLTRYFDLFVEPAADAAGATIGLVGATLDITERKLLEARLAAESEKSRLFLRNAGDGVHILDATGRIVEASDSFCAMLGYARDQVLGLQPLQWDTGRSPQQVADTLASVLSGERRRFETLHRRRDGTTFEVQIHANPFDIGGIRYLYCSATDLTEVRQLERALVDASAGEQRRLGQEMHDGLGQELTGLSLTAQALANRAERELLANATDLAQLATQIAHSIGTARAIVRGLSPLADAGGSLVVGLKELAKQHSIGDTVLHVTADEDAAHGLSPEVQSHLFRIAQEAVQNAMKHAAARRIDIKLTSGADEVRLLIADDGAGIQSPPASGSGQGMNTMRFRATAIHGRLAIESRPGSGTLVACSVPKPTPSTEAHAARVKQ